jgi:hypothetical protein
MNRPLPEKTCATCGRRMVWRAKWRNVWEEVRYCSDRCRGAKPGSEGDQLEAIILEELTSRKCGASICPSEIARKQFPADWRERMEEVRQAARRLVANGRIEITQGGQVVDPSTAKGPIRLRLKD